MTINVLNLNFILLKTVTAGQNCIDRAHYDEPIITLFWLHDAINFPLWRKKGYIAVFTKPWARLILSPISHGLFLENPFWYSPHTLTPRYSTSSHEILWPKCCNVVCISHFFHAYQHFLPIFDVFNLITLTILHEACILWSS